MIIKDEIALGALAGFLATIPQFIFNLISVYFSYSKFYSFQFSGSIFLRPSLTLTPLGIVIGTFMWVSMATVLGIIIVYLLKYTGKDYWWLKGILVSVSLMFTIIYGFLQSFGITKIVPNDIPTNLTHLIGNIIFGAFAGYFAYRFAPENEYMR